MTPPLDFYRLPLEVAKSRELTPAAKLVAAVIHTRMNGKRECWPSIRTLAADTGLALSTVQRAISELSKLGLFKVEAIPQSRTTFSKTVPILSTDAAFASVPILSTDCTENEYRTVPILDTEKISKRKRKERKFDISQYR